MLLLQHLLTHRAPSYDQVLLNIEPAKTELILSRTEARYESSTLTTLNYFCLNHEYQMLFFQFEIGPDHKCLS